MIVCPCPGFPKFISAIEVPGESELVIEALGPDVNKLITQCPEGSIGALSAIKLTSQLVSSAPGV